MEKIMNITKIIKKEIEALQDKECFNELDKAKAEKMFCWIELNDDQILLNQKICDLYFKFAKELIDIVPIGTKRDDALKSLVISEHHSLDAILYCDK